MSAFHNEFENLPETVRNTVQEIVSRTHPVALILFGSRARGSSRENSDFDFALKGKACSEDEWNQLLIDLVDEPFTLRKIDLVEFERLNKEYQDTITKEGLKIYG